jgi:hypothetical protein
MMRDWGTGSPSGRLIPEIGRCSLQKKTGDHGHDPRAIHGAGEESAGEEPEEPADYGGLNVNMISGS